jgi:uncharacterized protein (TIGR00369 family)
MPALSTEQVNAILAENFAPWVRATGITPEAIALDMVTLRIPFSDHLCRIGGIMCGQALITGTDTAMVIALAAGNGGFRPCTTVDLTIKYMRPITKADALLEAKVMRLGKALAFCACEVREAGGDKLAAFSTGTYFILG